MNINVVEILESQKLFGWYFDNRDYVLILVILLLLFLIIIGGCCNGKFFCEIGKRDYKVACGKILAHIAMAVIIGVGLNGAGMKFDFAVKHMPILLFLGAMLITVGIQVAECFRYSKTYQAVIKRTNIIFVDIISCMVLLLAIMGRLEIIELVAATIGCLTLNVINGFIDNCVKLKGKYKIGEDTPMGDCPISCEEELFESRKRQLNSVYKELDKFCEEPFAVAISGRWGSGKTSFVNVLRERLGQNEFVNIECSIEYDVKVVLKSLSLQMQKIYKKNKVYVGKNSVIDRYFRDIGEFVGDAGYGGMARIIDKFQMVDKGNYWENKDAINKELDMFYTLTGKRIYFIVDDMDRIIDDKMRMVLFQVIRESVGLNHCTTLFMIDYDKLTSECMSKEFLEKYVNHQFEL